ncbi:hypothetical protein M8J77_024515 [Diaphorina citri]|nr:hypothetical protein M8J77_024515 [Diaphorina citri]
MVALERKIQDQKEDEKKNLIISHAPSQCHLWDIMTLRNKKLKEIKENEKRKKKKEEEEEEEEEEEDKEKK